MSNLLARIRRKLSGERYVVEVDGSADRPRLVDLGKRQVEGEFIRQLCRDSSHRRLIISGGTVQTALDLSATEVDRPVEFRSTVFQGPVELSAGRFRELRFIGCILEEGLSGNGLTLAGDLDLAGCRIEGRLGSSASTSRRAAIWLCEAEIGGRLLARGLRINTQTETEHPLVRSLQADRMRVHGNVRLIEGFQAAGEVRMIGAEIAGSLDLTGCALQDPRLALDLAKIRLGGSLFIIPSPSAGTAPSISGRIDMSRATVAGQTLIRSLKSSSGPMGVDPAYYTYVRADEAVALWAPGSHFAGEVVFDNNCEIDGAVDLRGATFVSDLFLGGAQFTNEVGFSTDISNGTIGGDLTLSRSSRSICLNNLRVKGSVDGRTASVEATEGLEAVAARGLRVEGDVDFNAMRVDGGTLDLRLAQIAGDLRLREASLKNAGGRSLALSSGQVGGIVYLNGGFESEGTVRLNRCRIGGSLRCDGGSFTGQPNAQSSDEPAIDATNCEAATGMFLKWKLEGGADFSNARTSVLGDDVVRWGDDYSLAGFRYDRFSSDSADASVKERLNWLANQNQFDALSYEQLAAYYRSHGRSADAERLSIARNRALRRERLGQGGWRNLRSAAIDLLWDLSIGYGYRAGRAALAMVVLVLLTGSLLATSAGHEALRTTDEDNVIYSADGQIVGSETADRQSAGGSSSCAGGQVRCFSPWFYAVDTVVPLVDLHQRSTWYAAREAPYGRSIELGLNVVVLMGWAVSSALVLGLTNALGGGRK